MIEALTYTHDTGSNRTSLARANGIASLLPAAIASATYDAANEQTQFGGATLTYDANGSLTNDGINTYTWDARNRLVGISGGVTASFSYDALGRRISKTISGMTQSYLYAKRNLVAEISSGAVVATYLQGLRIDSPMARFTTTGNEYYHLDALNSTLALTDQSGAPKTAFIYEPYGASVMTGVPSQNPFSFTGREHDPSGLMYYRARYYNPRLHRFISEDPIDLAGGDFNLYAYVNGDPVLARDPTGMWASVYPFDVHQRADLLAFGDELTYEEQLLMNFAHHYADSPEFQTAETAFRHAMRKPNESIEKACKKADRFVREQFGMAWQENAVGNRAAALHYFTVGLHTLQDSTSPAHRGFQIWSGQEGSLEKGAHANAEKAYPGPGSDLDQVTRQAWEWFRRGHLPDKNLFGCGNR